MSDRVVVIHPFVQSYRRELYQQVHDRLADRGVEFVVVANPPAPRLAMRDDSIDAPWTQTVPCRWLRVAGRDVGHRSLQGLGLGASDHVIVEQAIKNLETLPLLLSPRRSTPHVAMWGHGRSFSTHQGPVLAAAKSWLTRRAEWFFAYTPEGARYVVDHGFPGDRVTVVWNTIDTAGLRRELDDLASESGRAELEAFRVQHGLTPGRTALFLGGVDEAKGIDFLLTAARVAAEQLPGFVLLVGGAGSAMASVEQAQAEGLPVRALGRVEGRRKAIALAAADVLAIPRWIGLVAVDSLVAGRPIVSTEHPSHSPERAYLEAGRTAVFAAPDTEAYATALTSLLVDSRRLQAMQEACRSEAAHYPLSRSVDAFVDGLEAWGVGARGGR